jgi:hypothetical protein
MLCHIMLNFKLINPKKLSFMTVILQTIVQIKGCGSGIVDKKLNRLNDCYQRMKSAV